MQTPAKGKGKEVAPKPALAKKDEISWESDSDDDAEGVYRELGMSPPKTIQFNLPQSRLLQTPGESRYLTFLLWVRILTFGSTRSKQENCRRLVDNSRCRIR